jgi:hypothetical protein
MRPIRKSRGIAPCVSDRDAAHDCTPQFSRGHFGKIRARAMAARWRDHRSEPIGRMPTKTFRPSLPVLPLLDEWLRAEYADSTATPQTLKSSRGWRVNSYGKSIQDVDRAWDTMLRALDYPRGPCWRSYVLRHSLATLCRYRGLRAGFWKAIWATALHRRPKSTRLAISVGSARSTRNHRRDRQTRARRPAPRSHRRERRA